MPSTEHRLPMNDDDLHILVARVTELEIKASYSDDLLEQLNLTIYRQQQQIEGLIQQARQLRQLIPEEGTTASRTLREELPPHY